MRRRYSLPDLLMPSSLVLPPVECCRGTNPNQAARSRPFSEADAVTNRGNECCRNNWPEAWHFHQAMAAIIHLRDAGELSTGFSDLPFELVPFMLQLTNQVQQ